MNSKDKINNKNEELNHNDQIFNKFINIKSDYFLQRAFDYMHKKISLEIIKYNKNLQQRLNININNYKECSEIYSSIEIEIIPAKNAYGTFINIKKEDEEYFHIYFNNNNKEEIKRTYLNEEDKVSKINIIINYQIISFNQLFYGCTSIESINFKKFYRNNITNMNYMFGYCSSLKELNLSNFNTNNVTNMIGMFSGCSALKELNLNNFKTNNVTDMSYMFGYCSSLRELNLSNFNTNNVTNMHGMFSKCLNVLKLHIKNNYKNFKKEAFL